MDGFTVKCNKCRKEELIQCDKDFREGEIDVFGNRTFEEDIPEVWIVCSCGNDI